MQTRAQCSCGWKLELSELYAGKQIRCPECERVVDVPGESTTPLYGSRHGSKNGSKLPQREHQGRWVCVPPSRETRANRGGGMLFVVLIVVAMIGLVRQCKRDATEVPGPQVNPSERAAPRTTPKPKPESKEEDF